MPRRALKSIAMAWMRPPVVSVRLKRLVSLCAVAASRACLLAAQRFGDQRIGQHQLGLRHVLRSAAAPRRLAGRDVVAPDPRGIAFDAEQHAAETLAAVDRHGHLDLHDVAGVALEIGAPHQRPVDAGRRHFQPVGAVDRIGDVEHRRQRARGGFAILDQHRAVGPLGHDLHGAAVAAGDAHAHQPIAEAFEHRLGDRGDARAQARLDDQARLGARRDIDRIVHRSRSLQAFVILLVFVSSLFG